MAKTRGAKRVKEEAISESRRMAAMRELKAARKAAKKRRAVAKMVASVDRMLKANGIEEGVRKELRAVYQRWGKSELVRLVEWPMPEMVVVGGGGGAGL
jgi:hypothetical protein